MEWNGIQLCHGIVVVVVVIVVVVVVVILYFFVKLLIQNLAVEYNSQRQGIESATGAFL